MSLEFEWEPDKAARNLRKHTVSFQEAATVFGDETCATVYDPDHSAAEERFLTIGCSNRGRLLIVSHTDRDNRIRIISARPLKPLSEDNMSEPKQTTDFEDELRPEYDLTELLKHAVRGKYAERYKAGTNLVLLAPDVAEAFPDEQAVNDALRLVMQLAKIPGPQREPITVKP